MEQLAILASGRNSTSSAGKKTIKRLTKSSKIIKTIIEAIGQKKGQRIVSLDLRKINEAVADFFIVCEASNAPQIRAVTDHVIDQVKLACSEQPFHQEGQQSLQWVLIDYVNVVVHIMHPDSRQFYRLEEMWSDAPLTRHGEEK